MNKKYGAYSLLMGFLVSNSLSFSMHNMPKIIYYGSKVITTSFIPLATMKVVYDSNKKALNEVASLPDVKQKTPAIHTWAEGIIAQSTDYNKNEVALKYGIEWSCNRYENQKYIILPAVEILLLESALEQDRRQKLTYVESFKEFFCGSSGGSF